MGGSAEDSSAKLEKKRRSLSRKKTADAVPKEAREGREGKERSSSKRDKPLATTHAVASSGVLPASLASELWLITIIISANITSD